MDAPHNEAAPSDAAILERAKSLGSEACYAIALQRRRLRSTEPEDAVFISRPWVDLQFMIVALRRLRRSALLAARVRLVAEDLQAAIKEFDQTLPSLAKIRNVGEHIDEYATDSQKRHHLDVSRRQLQVGSWDGKFFSWIVGLDIDTALKAAEKLFKAIKDGIAKFVAARNNAASN
jgi:hypothetical protein